MQDLKITEENLANDKSNLDDCNIYLLTKVNKILNGTLMKKWK